MTPSWTAVKQAAGKEAIPPNDRANPPRVIGSWDDVEYPIGYGYGARLTYGQRHASWNDDVERELSRKELLLAEAKRADIDSQAFGQCIATMVAAQRFNQTQVAPIFGCVTTGHDWQFLRLHEDVAIIDPQLYFQDRLDLILGILVSFLKPVA